MPAETVSEPATDVHPADQRDFGVDRSTPAASTGAEPTSADEPPPELQDSMREANRSYDLGDYESARAIAVEVLNNRPNPQSAERMLRIAASSSCFMGEADEARKYYERLTSGGQRDIARRCRRYGIEF